MRKPPPYLRLTFERHRRGWRQAELARRADMLQQVLSGIETGRINPTDDELARLADVLLISPPQVLMQPVRVPDPESEQVAS